MSRLTTTLTLILLLLFSANVFSADLPKCNIILKNFYNYHHDKEAFNAMMDTLFGPRPLGPKDSLSAPDSLLKPDSLQKAESRLKVDSSLADSSVITDSVTPDIIPAMPTALYGYKSDRQLFDSLVLNSISVYMIDGVPYISAYIRYHGDRSDLHSLGVIIIDSFGENVPADFPLSILPKIDSLPTVESIKAGGGRVKFDSFESNMSPGSIRLDSSVHDIKADSVHRLGITGKGVVIGVIDDGIDIFNNDFRDDSGYTRIKYIWDQTDYSGTPPPESGFGYGSEWTQSEINSILQAGGNPIAIDSSGHGTHVAGIAAGNGLQNSPGYDSLRYVGVAPDADLILIKLRHGQDQDIDVHKGVLYIIYRAKSMNKPYVINMSLGMFPYGAKNGTSGLESSIDDLITWGDTSAYGTSKAIVTSAGNERTEISNVNHDASEKIHASGIGADTVRLDLDCSPDSVWLPYSIDHVVLYIVYSNLDEYELTLHPVSGYGWYGPYGFGDYTGGYPGGGTSYPGSITDGLIFVTHEIWGCDMIDPLWGGHPDDYVIRIKLTEGVVSGDDYFRHLEPGIWELQMDHISGPGLRWDAYIFRQYPVDTLPKCFADASYDGNYTLTEPATGNNIISVGSYNSKDTWDNALGYSITMPGFNYRDMTYFSSFGPTRDGRDKPELQAPGAWIMSSRADGVTDASSTAHSNNPLFHDPDTVHCAMPGTSMAAPHIAGTIALMLQKNRALTYQEIKDILVNSSYYGYVDALAAVELTPQGTYICGDANSDGDVDLLDILYIIEHKYRFGPPPNPFESGDVDCDGLIDIRDILYLIKYLYKDGREPCADCPI